MSDYRRVPVPDGLAGMRVDQAGARLFGLSRNVVATMIDNGDVLIDGKPAKRSDRLVPDTWIEATLPQLTSPAEEEDKPAPGMTVIYEDAHIVVVDKPVGVAAHTGPGWTGPTVLSGLRAMGYSITTSGAPERQGIVHRLDVATSGVMAVALSEKAYSVLKRAFKQRLVYKKYRALVQGRLDPLQGTIDAAIGRHPGRDWKFAVTAEGKPSVTHYETIEAFRAASLLDINLETGRTHQIRVHMSAMRHPCVGDEMYGCDPTLAARLDMNRQALHAYHLAFEHPDSGDDMQFYSPDPADFAGALDILRSE